MHPQPYTIPRESVAKKGDPVVIHGRAGVLDWFLSDGSAIVKWDDDGTTAAIPEHGWRAARATN